MTGAFGTRYLRRIVISTIVLSIAGGVPVSAQDHSVDCKAVLSKATITLPTKLLLGISEDPNQKTCDFVVSMPPPHESTSAANAWYAAKLSDAIEPKFGTELVASLAVSFITERSKQYEKAILKEIFDNSKITSTCFTALFKKTPIDLKSENGRFWCSVPSAASQAVIRVATFNSFTLLMILPRSV